MMPQYPSRPGWPRPWSLVLLPLLAAAALLSAQEGLTPVSVPVPPTEIQLDEASVLFLYSFQSDGASPSESEQFGRYLLQSLRSTLGREGLQVQGEFPFPAPSLRLPEDTFAYVSRTGTDQGVRWVCTVEIALSSENLSWKLSVHDVKRGSIRALDAFSVYPGLSALPALDTACDRLADAFSLARAADREVLNLAEQSQLFSGSQDGVQVWYGTHGSGALAGTVREGTLEALYLPFALDRSLTLEVYKEGYWPKTVSLPRGVVETPIKLPVLQKKSVQLWGFGTGTGKLLGATFLYRYYPVPDRFFLRFDNSLWAGYSFMPGAVPFWHNELRFGMGLYLQNRVDGALRFAVGTGGSGILSYIPASGGGSAQFSLDLLIDPVWCSLEYHFPLWAVTFEVRLPYAAGNGFLYQGWLEDSGGGPSLSVGVLIK